MGRPLSVLFIEDSEDDTLLLLHELKQWGFEPVFERVETAEALLSALNKGGWEIVIADFLLPGFNGLEALRIVREKDPDLPFILVSAVIAEEKAVAAMRAGAQDYLMKDHLMRLAPAVERELADAAVRRERRRAEAEILKLNAELDQKVKERTKDLESSNRKLREEVTRRIQSEMKLRESEERFRKIFEEGAIGMTVVGRDLKFSRVNTAMCRMLGYSEEELTSMSFTDITHPEDVQVGLDLAGKLLRGDIPSFQIEKRYVTKKGKILWTKIGVSLIRDETGEPLYSLAMIEDISDKKKAEEELRRGREEFMTVLLHDLKKPLVSIVECSELLKDPGCGEIAPRKLEMAGVIQETGDFLLSLINNILDISHLEAGEMSFDFEEFPVEPFLQEIRNRFEIQADRGKVALEFSAPSNLWVKADRLRLRQIFCNLISNALRYTPEGGVISITIEEDDGKASVVVSDSGKGLTEEEQSLLFQKFCQLKDEESGSGLGLYIVKRLLEAHNSDIRVESSPGQGTTFFFHLPAGTFD